MEAIKEGRKVGVGKPTESNFYREAKELGLLVNLIGPHGEVLEKYDPTQPPKLQAPRPQFTRMIHNKRVRLTVIPMELGPVMGDNTYANALLKLEMMRPDSVTCLTVGFENPVRVEQDDVKVQVRRGRRFELTSPDLFLFFNPIKGAKALFRLWGAILSPQDK